MVKRTRQVKRVVGMAGGGKATQKAVSKTIKAGRALKAGNRDKASRAAAGAAKTYARTKQGKQLSGRGASGWYSVTMRSGDQVLRYAAEYL